MHQYLFKGNNEAFIVISRTSLSESEISLIEPLLIAKKIDHIDGKFVGPKATMISPFSTNALSIFEVAGLKTVTRVERFEKREVFDEMTEFLYEGLSSNSLNINNSKAPEKVFYVKDLEEFNKELGLALSSEEISFLQNAEITLSRKLTDVEVYAFAQINSEHCRHKIFNGEFVLDGIPQEKSLFSLIKDTAKANPKFLVSAYKDNVAFISGPKISEFHPDKPNIPSQYGFHTFDSAISIKAETHNFPTTVEPFNGAATGSGGEIRDRMAGGRGSIPLSGIAVYMTAPSRLTKAGKTLTTKSRKWKYQTPEEILIKASVGASDFGNKFGQPLLAGTVLTSEFQTSSGMYGYDRCIMLAGGVGYGKLSETKKYDPKAGDLVVVLGGDNYRIGLAGGSVSSVDTGALKKSLELSAVQRANAEMQKRVYNVVRAFVQSTNNPIISIHDHGAGGHANCFSELIETGGIIDIDALPIGDDTLSIREILSNESQERMGLLITEKDIDLLFEVAKRERAPCYVVGKVTADGVIQFVSKKSEIPPFKMPSELLFGASPKIVLSDDVTFNKEPSISFSLNSGKEFLAVLTKVLSLEGVACKDWLTNKVDRCVSGKVARQQCVGVHQFPLSNVSVTALDFTSDTGIATAIGSTPNFGLIDASLGAKISILKSLTNIVSAKLTHGLSGVALSANWMWPCKNPGEDKNLYAAVKSVSETAISLGISIPTGKDSLSMTMRYEDGEIVKAPGTVIITAVSECKDLKKTLTPVLNKDINNKIYFLSFAEKVTLGGTALSQVLGKLGCDVSDISLINFKDTFDLIQKHFDDIESLHDVSYGGVITSLLEMGFASDCGLKIFSLAPNEAFSESPGFLLQLNNESAKIFQEFSKSNKINFKEVASVSTDKSFSFEHSECQWKCTFSELLNAWTETSSILDALQTKPSHAQKRYENFGKSPLNLEFPNAFTGKAIDHHITLGTRQSSGIKAAVIREQGTNGERELSFALYCAGFDVIDVTMTDLISGKMSLKDISLIGLPGGFAHSDVLGAGRGFASSFLSNKNVKEELEAFYARKNTLSIGICNGCQVVAALGMIYSEDKNPWSMNHNESGRFECQFVEVHVKETQSVFLKPLEGSKLGIWVAHGEGRFSLPMGESHYDIPLKYSSKEYPLCTNGADFGTAAISSNDGRHLAIMPHLERSLLPWNWGHYPSERKMSDEISPWFLGFRAAFEWCKNS